MKNYNHIENKLYNITDKSGVYQMMDKDNNIIYIGKAKNLKKRLSSYFNKSAKDTKTTKLVNQIFDFNIIVVDNEIEALLLENELIKKYQPRYNILLKDAKSYPYIVISKEKNARIFFYRGRKNDKNHYFGPYPSANFVRDSIKLLRKAFKIRECSNSFYKNRSRPCLDYQIGICSAPCVYDNNDYVKDVNDAIAFMQGKSEDILSNVRYQMQQASKNLDFEMASRYRDQMINLQKINDSSQNNLNFDVVFMLQQGAIFLAQVIFIRDGKQIDSDYLIPRNTNNLKLKEVLSAFIALYYSDKIAPKVILVQQEIKDRDLIAKGLKTKIIKRVDKDKVKFLTTAKLSAKENLKQYLLASKRVNKQLTRIKQILDLEDIPVVIECFDISHHAGENTVASCVNFKDGLTNKKSYKRFNIKTTNTGDDYMAMTEALSRRYKNKENLPDLLLIDGGLGQLNVALGVLEQLKINLLVLGVAKGEGRKAGLETLILKTQGEVKRINLKPDDIALNLINYIRDEAHRFAITAHRKKSLKQKTKFGLENIEGIGTKKAKEILNYFGSLKEVKEAGAVNLTKVRGINDKMANKIIEFLRKQ